jgi:hypothetical protein
MAQPTPYNRLYNFTDFQTVNPTTPLPATALDNELNAVQLTAAQIRNNLALIQRDDGALANQSVTPDSLSAGALAMISQGEYEPRGAWTAAVAYDLGDLVTFNAATYLCIVAHTSVVQFATDLAANKWLLIANGALSGGSTAVDLFEGNGSTTTFTLTYTYNGSNAATVFVGGVAQIPVQDFTIAGTTLTLLTAPPSPAVAGKKNVMVRGTGVEAQLAADAATTAATNATASATAAANSATSASTSAGTATTQAGIATTQATNATTQATTATTQAGIATTQAGNAATSATTATNQATTATTQATNASNSATAAFDSATTAILQANVATSQATASGNSAASAQNSASAAATSASTASGAATTATNQATTATTAATSAGTSATNAANSASSASTSASNAAASASSASTSSSSASTSATNAAASATTATTQAGIATTGATTATTQAGIATTQASAASASASAAAASFDSFDDRYLGAKASDPSVDNDGNALLTGALYFSTTANLMRVYTGSIWKDAASSVNGTSARQVYTATAGQTSFAMTYDVGFVDVYQNGVKLTVGTEFTATNGTSIVLVTGAAGGDVIDIVAFGTFVLANMVAKTGDTMTGDLVFNTTGAITLPAGTTAERPAGVVGKFRFNSSLSKFEGYNGSAWGPVGGGATGGGSDDIFIENGQTVTTNYTLSTGKNAGSFGPISIADGVTVTVPSGQVWTIV